MRSLDQMLNPIECGWKADSDIGWRDADCEPDPETVQDGINEGDLLVYSCL